MDHFASIRVNGFYLQCADLHAILPFGYIYRTFGISLGRDQKNFFRSARYRHTNVCQASFFVQELWIFCSSGQEVVFSNEFTRMVQFLYFQLCYSQAVCFRVYLLLYWWPLTAVPILISMVFKGHFVQMNFLNFSMHLYFHFRTS